VAARNTLQGLSMIILDEPIFSEAEKAIIKEEWGKVIEGKRLGDRFEKVLFDNLWELYD
jgi:hypothetical protein